MSNFQAFVVVGRGSETQFQVGKKYNKSFYKNGAIAYYFGNDYLI